MASTSKDLQGRRLSIKMPMSVETASPVTRGLTLDGVNATFTPQMGRLHSAFEVGPVIGRGGFSEVRAVRCKRTGREMAMKVIGKAQHQGKPKALRRLRDEIRVLASLRHPNIVAMLAVYETPTHLLLVMDRAHGGELFDRIVARGHFTETDAITVTQGMLSALAHLHAHGAMHRDVKPENLLLAHPDRWEVQLSDFGLVRVMEDTWQGTRAARLKKAAAALGKGRSGKGRSRVLPGVGGGSSEGDGSGGGASSVNENGMPRVSMEDEESSDSSSDDDDDDDEEDSTDSGDESPPPPPPYEEQLYDDVAGGLVYPSSPMPAPGPLTLCGSSYYVAPEVLLRQGQYTEAVDVWSAGVVVYTMLVGSPPFERPPAFNPEWQPSFPNEWGWDAVSHEAKAMLTRMLCMDPHARVTAAQCLQDPWLLPLSPLTSPLTSPETTPMSSPQDSSSSCSTAYANSSGDGGGGGGSGSGSAAATSAGAGASSSSSLTPPATHDPAYQTSAAAASAVVSPPPVAAMDEVPTEASATSGMGGGTEIEGTSSQGSLSPTTTVESMLTSDATASISGGAAATVGGNTAASGAMLPPQARRVLVGTAPSKKAGANARKKKQQATALSPRYMSDMRAFNAKRKLSNASTPTLASRKDLQSPAPLRTKDAATVARDEQEALNSLNSLSVRDPNPTSAHATAAMAADNSTAGTSGSSNSRSSITSEATHLPPTTTSAPVPAPRAGTPTAAELAERRRRAMDIAGFVQATEWTGARPGYVFRSGECGVGYYLDLGQGGGGSEGTSGSQGGSSVGADASGFSSSSFAHPTGAGAAGAGAGAGAGADTYGGAAASEQEDQTPGGGEGGGFMREDTFELEDLDVLGTQVTMAPLLSLDPYQLPPALHGSYEGPAGGGGGGAAVPKEDPFLGTFGTAALIAGSGEGAWGIQGLTTPSTVHDLGILKGFCH